MKKIILVAVLFCFYLSGFSQLHISTNLRSDYTWDSEEEEWVLQSTDDESITFFEFNDEFTLVKHTTATITSGYMIKSQEHDNEDGRDQYIFDIVSDVGNKYIMILDFKNENLRFVANDGSFMVQHNIKSSWTEED